MLPCLPLLECDSHALPPWVCSADRLPPVRGTVGKDSHCVRCRDSWATSAILDALMTDQPPMQEFNIPQNLVDDAMAIVETTREAVMGRVGKAKAGGGARSKGSDMSALLWATGVGAVATAVFTSIFLRPSK